MHEFKHQKNGILSSADREPVIMIWMLRICLHITQGLLLFSSDSVILTAMACFALLEIVTWNQLSPHHHFAYAERFKTRKAVFKLTSVGVELLTGDKWLTIYSNEIKELFILHEHYEYFRIAVVLKDKVDYYSDRATRERTRNLYGVDFVTIFPIWRYLRDVENDNIYVNLQQRQYFAGIKMTATPTSK